MIWVFCPCQWWVSKSLDGEWVGGVTSIQVFFGFLEFFSLCKAPYRESMCTFLSVPPCVPFTLSPRCLPGSRGRRHRERHMVPQRVPHTEAAQHGKGSGQEGNGCRGDVAPDVAAAEEPGPDEVGAECPLLLRPFPYLGSVHRVFNLHVLQSCASSIFTWFSFLSFLIISLHLSFLIFLCPPTSIFHVLITTSSSVFLSTLPNHLSHGFLIVSRVCYSSLVLISSFLIFSILYSHHPSQYSQFLSF